jgi:hypothetical protein
MIALQANMYYYYLFLFYFFFKTFLLTIFYFIVRSAYSSWICNIKYLSIINCYTYDIFFLNIYVSFN